MATRRVPQRTPRGKHGATPAQPGPRPAKAKVTRADLQVPGLQVLHTRCAGLDVHKRTVVACVLTAGADGAAEREVRTFNTMTAGLEALADWLTAHDVTDVGMEATGVSWQPVYNVLEARERFTLVVANAEHLAQVPGRKTDLNDATWLAVLLRHGLVRGSYIPDREHRERRALTRYRTALIRDRADEVNRLQKTLEAANIKLAAVLTDILGVSGQRILDALLAGETDPEQLADLAHWRVQAKREALEQAVVGQLEGTLAFVAQQQLDRIRDLEARIAVCDAKVAEVLAPFAAQLRQLQSIPGVGERTAQVFLAEAGADLQDRFPTHRHFAAWAGMCPGNRQSGGKRRPAKTRKGSPWLRAALAEAGWAAGRKKEGYLPALYRRLSARRGRKRAVVAVGHAILVIAYHLLTEGTLYEDLGGTYFDQRDRDAVRRRAVQRLEALGYTVDLKPAATEAA